MRLWQPIHGLVSAESCRKPQNLPRGRATSRAAANLGLRYEKKVVLAISESITTPKIRLEHNPWFRFVDSSRSGYASPDILLFCGSFMVIVEIKYTFTVEALRKVRRFYEPIVRGVYQLPAIPMIVARNLTPEAPKPNYTIHAALGETGHLLHWMGEGKISWV